MNRVLWRQSLRVRMTLGFTLTFAVFLCLVGVFLQWQSYQNKVADTDQLLREAVTLVNAEWEKESKGTISPTLFNEVREDPVLADVSLLLVDAAGLPVITNRRAVPEWPAVSNEWRIFSAPLGTATLVAGIRWRPIEKRLRSQAVTLATLGLMAILFAAALSWTLVGRTLRPIGYLSQQAANAASDPLHLHLEAPSNDDEIKQLVATLNGMLGRLRENARSREQFYAAAAHELRTPLTVLSSTIEVTKNRPRSVGEYQEALDDLEQQTRRLIHLSEDLLTLNRLDMGTVRDVPESVDLVDLVERALASVRLVIAGRNLQLIADLETEDATALVPSLPAGMLIRNLIENAAKYAREGGGLTVSWHSDTDWVELRVANDFPVESQLDTDRLFEPFYRADASRSSATGGNGLGLAICRRIADMNGWQLSLVRHSREVVASVQFPRA